MEPGTRLGPYEILEPLGAGGMGEVWLANDTRLGRAVAIKVLPQEFATDPERLARFDREARVLASLSHTNIGAIFGLEEFGGAPMLVLERIEGESLGARLKRGALPLREALEVARQVAAGLAAAHEAGVVHRDVKPDNVLLTPQGSAKVTDFGIAKQAKVELSGAETRATALTVGTTLLGTPPYMAPEQVRGEETDQRADVWAFGCVLYEMLAGTPAFARETVADTVVAVLDSDPDWQALPGEAAHVALPLLRRCLKKDRDCRQRDMADVRIELEDALAIGSHAGSVVPPSAPLRRASAWRWIAAAAVVIAVAAALASGGLPAPRVDSSPWYLELGLPPGVLPGGAALSDDGRLLIFIGGDAAGTRLYLKHLDRPDPPMPVPDTEGASCPLVSPDGDALAYFAEGQLRRMQVDGRTSEWVADVPGSIRGCTWGADGRITFSAGFRSPLQSVRAAGGDVTRVTELTAALPDVSHRFPAAIGGGRLLYEAQVAGDTATIRVLSADGESRDLLSGSQPHLVGGQILTFRRSSPTGGSPLWGVLVDPDTLEPRAEPVALLTEVSSVAIASNGTLAYAPTSAGTGSLVIVDPEGQVATIGDDASFTGPSWSPDGQRIAVARDGREVWIYEVPKDGGTLPPYRLTDNGWDPAWSFDGGWVYFARRNGIHAVARTGGPSRHVYETGHRVEMDNNATSQGLLFTQVNPLTEGDLYLLQADEAVRPVLEEEFPQWTGALSPDGRFLAIAVAPQPADADNRIEIQVAPFPALNPRYTIATNAIFPQWGARNERLFYETSDGVVELDLDSGTGAPMSPPRIVFGYATVRPVPRTARLFDVRREDGALVVARRDTPPAGRFHVLLNWGPSVSRRLRAGP